MKGFKPGAPNQLGDMNDEEDNFDISSVIRADSVWEGPWYWSTDRRIHNRRRLSTKDPILERISPSLAYPVACYYIAQGIKKWGKSKEKHHSQTREGARIRLSRENRRLVSEPFKNWPER